MPGSLNCSLYNSIKVARHDHTEISSADDLDALGEHVEDLEGCRLKMCSSISGLPYDINQGCHVSYLGGGGGVVGDALVVGPALLHVRLGVQVVSDLLRLGLSVGWTVVAHMFYISKSKRFRP